MYITAATV